MEKCGGNVWECVCVCVCVFVCVCACVCVCVCLLVRSRTWDDVSTNWKSAAYSASSEVSCDYAQTVPPVSYFPSLLPILILAKTNAINCSPLSAITHKHVDYSWTDWHNLTETVLIQAIYWRIFWYSSLLTIWIPTFVSSLQGCNTESTQGLLK